MEVEVASPTIASANPLDPIEPVDDGSDDEDDCSDLAELLESVDDAARTPTAADAIPILTSVLTEPSDRFGHTA